jgi:tripartite-type tricarboxylate transporter receptor subunit TctC
MENQMNFPIARVLACSMLALAASLPAYAQNFPDRPVHLIIPYGPGGIVDFAGRVLAQKIGDALGQTVVPENKPGAGGIVGVDYVAHATPDGYSMALMDPGMVAPQLGVRTYAELVAYGKANPGKLNYASAGVGTTPHLAAEMWKLRTGIDAVHVPYKGIGGSFTDMMSNKVQMAFSSIAGALPFTGDNRIVPLATTGTTRSAVYPDLPTVAEAGLPGYSVDLWLSLYGTAGTPPDVQAKLNSAINKALQDGELKTSFAKFGLTPRGTSLPEGAAFTKDEYLKWKKVIEDGHITLD